MRPACTVSNAAAVSPMSVSAVANLLRAPNDDKDGGGRQFTMKGKQEKKKRKKKIEKKKKGVQSRYHIVGGCA